MRSASATASPGRSAIRWADTASRGYRAALLICALAACGSDGARVYPARGVVQEVQPEYAQVVIAHEDIEGLMPAMTMNFDVPDPALLAKLAPGQLIDFELEFTGKAYRVIGATVRGTGEAPPPGRARDPAPGPGDPAPDFELTDQDGEPFALSQLRGRVLLLDFVYTECPGPCPLLTGRHVDVQRALTPEQRGAIHFVSVSLDPERDTPEALRRYARARGADLADWSFVTGSPETADPVLRSYGLGVARQPDGNIDHRVLVFLIDREGRVARRFLGLDHEPEALAAALVGLSNAEGSGGAGR